MCLSPRSFVCLISEMDEMIHEQHSKKLALTNTKVVTQVGPPKWKDGHPLRAAKSTLQNMDEV